MKASKDNRPLDINGVLLSKGDRVKGTPGGGFEETGEVLLVIGRCINVRYDKSQVTWRTAAALWQKLPRS